MPSRRGGRRRAPRVHGSECRVGSADETDPQRRTARRTAARRREGASERVSAGRVRFQRFRCRAGVSRVEPPTHPPPPPPRPPLLIHSSSRAPLPSPHTLWDWRVGDARAALPSHASHPPSSRTGRTDVHLAQTSPAGRATALSPKPPKPPARPPRRPDPPPPQPRVASRRVETARDHIARSHRAITARDHSARRGAT